MVESKPLGEENYKFVDLVDLGKKLKQKEICWQDMEFKEVIRQICRKYSKLNSIGVQAVSNIIIGTDGSVHLLAIFDRYGK